MIIGLQVVCFFAPLVSILMVSQTYFSSAFISNNPISNNVISNNPISNNIVSNNFISNNVVSNNNISYICIQLNTKRAWRVNLLYLG